MKESHLLSDLVARGLLVTQPTPPCFRWAKTVLKSLSQEQRKRGFLPSSCSRERQCRPRKLKRGEDQEHFSCSTFSTLLSLKHLGCTDRIRPSVGILRPKPARLSDSSLRHCTGHPSSTQGIRLKCRPPVGRGGRQERDAPAAHFGLTGFHGPRMVR